MINLSNITLINLDGCEPENSLKTLEYCCKDISFESVKLITYEKVISNNVEVILVPKLSQFEYNKFLIENLNDFVDTEFCILIQNDGFICNPKKWQDKFLNFDYIGSPWGQDWGSNCKYRVGNGGFSLRSKKFLQTVQENIKDFGQNLSGHLKSEDYFLCYNHRDYLESLGLKWADLETASQWGLEGVIPEFSKRFGETLGFHNKSTPESQALIRIAQS